MRQKFNEYLGEPKREERAKIWKRIIAYSIDNLLVVVVIMLVVFGLTAIEKMFGLAEWVFMLATIVVSLVCTVYLFLKDGWDGRGIGKRLMKIQIIDVSTGKPITFKIAALRYLMLRVLSLVEVIFIFVQPNHRGIGDWLGHSIVVKR